MESILNSSDRVIVICIRSISSGNNCRGWLVSRKISSGTLSRPLSACVVKVAVIARAPQLRLAGYQRVKLRNSAPGINLMPEPLDSAASLSFGAAITEV